MEICDGHDHRLGTYAASDRRLLALVEEFDADVLRAMDEGVELAGVTVALDPDPARYTWVDEGGGLVETVLARARDALAGAPRIPGFRRLASAVVPGPPPEAALCAASRPGVACGPDGLIVVAWIEWDEGVGERVVAGRFDRTLRPIAAPEAVFERPTDCLRPTVVCDAEGRPWVFFGARRDEGVGVYCSKSATRGWTEPELVSTTGFPSFNQEVVRLTDGALECCWQGFDDGRFAIFRRSHDGRRWGDTEKLSEAHERNVWDPTVAALGDGKVAYGWTTYGDGGYETVVLTPDPAGAGGRRHRLSAPCGYSLHPSLAATPDGALWCAFDAVKVAAHAGSGTTGLRTRGEMSDPPETGVRPDGLAVPGDLAPDVRAEVRVVRLENGGSQFVDTGRVGASVLVSPSGLPRLAVSGDGSVAVVYRCMRRLPLMVYFWDVVAEWAVAPPAATGEQASTPGWAGLTTFEGSDGPLEETAVVPTSEGIAVAWQQDGRRDVGLGWTEGFGGGECEARREHYGEVVWHSVHRPGRIRVAPVPVLPRGELGGLLGAAVSGLGAAASGLGAERSSLGPTPAEARRWSARSRHEPQGRYRTSVGNTSYGLYYGDLHRHSLISRCTAGDEPCLEDFYRYSFDVCEYDFWAVTDHAENTSSYQWWSIQKIADVLHVDGRFIPFYGFEWTAATGHQNVIYESSRRGAPLYSSTAEATSTPDKLWAALRRSPGYPSLTIPHHPGSAMVPFDWSYHDEDQLRLVEIFQACRGNYGASRHECGSIQGSTFGTRSCGRTCSMGPRLSMTSASAAFAEWKP